MERRKFVIGAGALATGSAAAMGTGAFTAARVDNREANIAVNGDDAALIQLIPGYDESVAGADSTVSDNRVDYDDSKQLYISFEADDESGSGVNPNSTYQVGAIGDTDAEKGLDESNIAGISSSDVLNGGAGNGVSDYPAFVIRNESDETYNISIGYDAESAPTDELPDDEAAAVLVGSESDSWGAEFALELRNEAAKLSTELGQGEELAISLIATVGDLDGMDPDNVSAWQGSLQIDAGETVDDEFTD